MALSTVVPENPLGIKGKFLTQNASFTNPIKCTKKALMLHSTATPGAPAQNFFPGWNKSSTSICTEFIVDDTQILQFMPIGKNGVGCVKTSHSGSGPKGSCNRTHIGTEMCEPIQTRMIPVNYYPQGIGQKYTQKYPTQRIQMELKARGFYEGSTDGAFGAKTAEAVKKFQASIGKAQTGIVDKALLATLANREGSYCKYDVAGATPFFNAVYNRTVHLFAWLCSYVGAKPSEIICHSEGHAKGIASGHADVMHWFPYHGKNMDIFRKDVADDMASKFVDLGTPVKVVKSEYEICVDKMVSAGIINSPSLWVDAPKAGTISANAVKALIRQSAAYFCKKNVQWAQFVIAERGLPGYTNKDNIEATTPAQFLKDLAGTLVGRQVSCESEAFTLLSGSAKILKGPDLLTDPESNTDVSTYLQSNYWHDLVHNQNVPIREIPNGSGNAMELLRAVALFLCANSHVFAVDAIKYPIGMNSEAYWKGDTFKIGHVECLVRAIGKAV